MPFSFFERLSRNKVALLFLAAAVFASLKWIPWWLKPLPLVSLLSLTARFYWEDFWPPFRNAFKLEFLKHFWDKWYREALLPLLLIMVVVSWGEDSGWFKHLEATFLDTFIRVHGHKIPTKLFIVEITDDDYTMFFNEKSPLTPGPVLKLIKAVRRGTPAVIGVDLDTRNEGWSLDEKAENEKAEKAKKVKNKKEADDAGTACQDAQQLEDYLEAPNIVWAEVPIELPASEPNKEPTLQHNCVLGGKLSDAKRGQIGIVRFPEEADGVVRRLSPTYKIRGSLPNHCLTAKERQEEGGGSTSLADRSAFYRAVADQCRKAAGCNPKNLSVFENAAEWIQRKRPPTIARWVAIVIRQVGNAVEWLADALEDAIEWLWRGADDKIHSLVCRVAYCAPEDEYFNFSGDQYSFQIVQASEFLNCFDEKGKPVKCEPPPFKSFEPALTTEQTKLLNGNIVLIGGSFVAARDRYRTPLGEMAGVELIGNAVESDLHGNIISARWLTRKLTDLIMGSLVVLVCFIWRKSPGIATVASLVLPFFLLLLGEVFFFYFVATWLNFAPVMGGMLIHQMWENTHLSRDLWGDVEKERGKLRLEERSAQNARAQAEKALFTVKKLRMFLERKKRRGA